jgi:hypothetical protein
MHESTLVAHMEDGMARIDVIAGRLDEPLAGHGLPARVIGVIATSPKTD